MKLQAGFFTVLCIFSLASFSGSTLAASCDYVNGTGQYTSIGSEIVALSGPSGGDYYYRLVTLVCNQAGEVIERPGQTIEYWEYPADVLSGLLASSNMRVFANECGTPPGTRFVAVSTSYPGTIDGVSMSLSTHPVPVPQSAYPDEFPEPLVTPLMAPCYVPPPPVIAAPELGKTCSANDASLNIAGTVNVTTGNEYHAETDFNPGGFLGFRRNYNSQANYRGALGPKWQHNFERKLLINGATALILRADGRVLEFTDSGGSWSSTMEPVATLEDMTSPFLGYQYTTVNGTVEFYDDQGQWDSTTTPNGVQITADHNANGDLIKVKDAFGNAITFTYNGPEGKLDAVTVPGALTYTYTYNSDDMLASATPPGNTGTRSYHYDEDTYPQTLNGITDENGDRLMTWIYDANARVVAEYSGEDDAGVVLADKANNYTFDYDTANQKTTATNSLGKDTIYHYTEIGGVKKITEVEGAVAPHCAAANQDYTHYPDTGLVHTKTDWQGNVTEYTYDSRGLEDTRIEARGTLEQRTIDTDWHPTFNRPIVITETGRTTSFTYNAGGQLTAKTLTDTSGQGSPSRTWTYTYTYTNGQIATIDGPLPGTVDVDTFDYQGNGYLWKRTNALGHVTEVLSHNDWGLPTRIKDPNGVESTLDYSAAAGLKHRICRLAPIP